MRLIKDIFKSIIKGMDRMAMWKFNAKNIKINYK